MLTAEDEFDLHVNVSARQLHRPDLVADVWLALQSSGLPARHLTLEISEPGLPSEAAIVAERLRELRRLGVRIAIDDFGTGRSSLSHLRVVPADIIKIDKVFTDELADEAQPYPVAKALVALATSLGLGTIAEGVEHSEQVEQLIALGCTRGQGYYYGHPVSAAALSRLLTRSADDPHPLVGNRG